MHTQELVRDIIRIAREAGHAILEVYASGADFEIVQKDDHSPLTKADRASNALICQALEQLTPQYPIISEENKEIPFAERRHYTHCWIIDPLDGTKEFIRRNDEFTVNIALIRDGRPILGVVYAPVLDEMYWGVRDGGAYVERNRKVEKLRAATFQLSDERLNLVCSRSHLNPETEAFVRQFKQPNLVSKGSSLKLMLLAKGAAHVYPRLAPTMEWDIAAGQVILEEAGGTVLNYNSGQPLRYNKEELRNPYFVAYGQVK